MVMLSSGPALPSVPLRICFDFADVNSVMREGGIAVVGIGEATGQGRATRAVEAAILDLKRQLAAVRTGSEASLNTLLE
jgi:cell division GTPase FtsZ